MKHLFNFIEFNLNEGGNAFPGAQSIKKEDVENLFIKFKEAISEVFGPSDLELIGSWRQKSISGDLDTLFYSDLSLPQISEKLLAAGFENKIFYGFNIVSVNFMTGEKSVQFDLFVRPLHTNREVNDLFYKSPLDEKYSTKHRVFLIFCALDSMKFDKTEIDGKLTRFKGYMLRPDGLYEFTKELKKKNYAITDKHKITEDLGQISQLLFGEVLPYSKWNTYEKTLSHLRKNQALNITLILDEYRQKLEQEGLAVPTDLN